MLEQRVNICMPDYLRQQHVRAANGVHDPLQHARRDRTENRMFRPANAGRIAAYALQ